MNYIYWNSYTNTESFHMLMDPGEHFCLYIQVQ